MAVLEASPLAQALRAAHRARATKLLDQTEPSGPAPPPGTANPPALEEEDEEGLYGRRTALLLTRSRALVDAVRDDGAVLVTEGPPGPGAAWTAAETTGSSTTAPEAHAARKRRGRRGRKLDEVDEGLDRPQPVAPLHNPSDEVVQEVAGRADGAEAEDQEREHAPAAADELAWENEIARNILNLYSTKVWSCLSSF